MCEGCDCGALDILRAPAPSCRPLRAVPNPPHAALAPRPGSTPGVLQIELENRVLLEKMSKIMRQNPTQARSALGGRHSEQFPFRSTLQLKPGVRVDKSHYPVL